MTSHFKVGERIAELLESCGDPHGHVMAKQMGKTPMTIHRWKKADDMKLSNIVDVCEYFGLTFEEFFNWEEQQ
jgi:hypothetical protein